MAVQRNNFVRITKNQFLFWIGANVLVLIGLIFAAGEIYAKVNKHEEQLNTILDVVINSAFSK